MSIESDLRSYKTKVGEAERDVVEQRARLPSHISAEERSELERSVELLNALLPVFR